MNLEIEQIEELLHRMQPRSLSAETKDRIHCAVSETQTAHPLQSAISSARPSPLPPELAKRLEESLSRIPHPGTGKVVHFPPIRRESKSPPAWRKLAVAAAVALLGAVSALLVPENQPTRPAPVAQAPATQASPANRPASKANPASLVPAGYRRGLSEAKDEGIVWQSHYGPHRRLKLVYRELVTLRDSSGRIYQVERPRTEYVLVPAKID